MKILDIVIKDLRQTVTTWQTPIFLVIMPILFTVFFGIAFSGAANTDPRAAVAVVNADTGRLSDALVAMVANSTIVRPVEVADTSITGLRSAILNGDLAGALVIPVGYTDAVLANNAEADLRTRILYDPGEQAGQAAGNDMQKALLRVLGAAEAARIAADAPGMSFADSASRTAFLEDAASAALNAWNDPPVTIAVELGGQPSQEGGLSNAYAQSSPGMMLQFGISGVMSSAILLVSERKKRTLQRLLSTATHRSEIVAGKLLAAFVLIFGQMLLLTGFGQLVYGLPYYSHPVALLLLNGVFAATVACMGLLVGAIARNEEVVIILTLIPTFILAALGGAWVPLEIMPQGVRAFAKIVTPTAWAMEAYQDLIVRGLGLHAVSPALGVMALWAAGFFAVALWRLRFVEG